LISISASGTECPVEFRYNSGTLYSPSYDTVSNLSIAISINTPNYFTNGQQPAITQTEPTLVSGKLYKA
jgi:hypothetical protein